MVARLALFFSSLALIGATSSNLPELKNFTVPLTGQAESGPVQAAGLGGDMDARGVVELKVDLAKRQICYDFTLSDAATPLMAHIHKGPPHQDGPSVVTLFTGPGVDLRDCVPWTEKWLAAITADPANFYVNVSTTEYPDGAVRGQLLG